MEDPIGDYKGKNCVVFGASSDVGREMGRHLSQSGVNLCLIDLDVYGSDALVEEVKRPGSGTKVLHRLVTSGDEDDFTKAVDEAASELGSIDYLICAYYLEEVKSREPDDLSIDRWDELLEEWVLNYFLVARAVVPHMIPREMGRVIFVNTTTGYTGEGEGEGALTGGGSIHECACSSAITGMMTSIARDIIPKGISVNGISLGPDYENDMERAIWATDFWLSGLCEYACGQVLRLY